MRNYNVCKFLSQLQCIYSMFQGYFHKNHHNLAFESTDIKNLSQVTLLCYNLLLSLTDNYKKATPVCVLSTKSCVNPLNF